MCTGSGSGGHVYICNVSTGNNTIAAGIRTEMGAGGRDVYGVL